MGAFERVAQEMARSPILRSIGTSQERDAEGEVAASSLPEHGENGTNFAAVERVDRSEEQAK